METLNENIDSRIAANDADFMEAYRGHMLKIQKELDRLRKKTNECEFIIKKDERVRKLEAQIVWFREEALFLSNKVQKLTKDIERYKEKCFNLEEERSYHLEIQENEIKKNNILRKALEHSQKNCEQLVQITKTAGIGAPIEIRDEGQNDSFKYTALNENAYEKNVQRSEDDGFDNNTAINI